VVLTRGYGGNPGAAPLLVHAGTGPEHSGDEALMLAQAFPEAAVLAFPQRSRSALYAQRTLNPDLFIMDDGMQHLGMGRHADIVLLRPEDLGDEWNRVIPAGSWREGASALASASAFAVKADAETFARMLPLAEKRLSAFGRGFFSFTLCPSGLRPLFMETEARYGHDRQGEPAPHSAVEPVEEAADQQRPTPALLDKEQYYDRPYILMSGVGNPAQVQDNAVRLMGRPPKQRLDFADHHPYSPEDVLAVAQLANGALPVICTPKDAVKLGQLRRQWGCTPVWVMETQLRFGPCLFSKASFPQWWENWWQTQGNTD
jgi:tetraacyldisaccharide 4'-kinase